MGRFPEPGWLSDFQTKANEDLELGLIGEKFSADVGISFGATRYVLRVRGGKVAEVVPSPSFDVPTHFGMRAPVEIWRKFLSAEPPPLYHDIFPMIMRVPEFVLDGDTLVAMQNARALQRLMNVMQGMGEGHA